MEDCTVLLEVPDNLELFAMGELCISKQANALLRANEVLTALNCHVRGDWSTLSEPDRQRNDNAVEFGGAIMSDFKSTFDIAFSVLTCSLRQKTIVFLDTEDPVLLDV